MPSNPARLKIDLTDKRVERLAPARPGKRYIAWDVQQPQFGVRVTSGTTDRPPRKTFFVFRKRGGAGYVGVNVGYFPAMTVAEAREKAAEIIRTLARGQHPKEIEKERQREEARRRRDTFAVVAEDFIGRHVKQKRTAGEYESIIRRELIGRWGARPVTEVTRRDVIEMLEGVADRSGPYAANHAFSAARALFNWAVLRDFYGLEASPCDRIRPKDIVGQVESRDRILSDDEVRLVWRAANQMGDPHGALVKLWLLTGQRRNEIADAIWQEIDAERALLAIPAERMKTKKAHVVPLTSTALALLLGLPRGNAGPFVLSTTAGRAPVSGFTKMKKRLDRIVTGLAKAELPRWTFHDLRRTVISGMAEAGVPSDHVERVVAHAQPGMRRIYDRYDYADEKRAALAKWERHVLVLVGERQADDKVVPIGVPTRIGA